MDKEYAATRRRFLAFVAGTDVGHTAERGAKACSVLPSTDRTELEAVLALGRTAVKDGREGASWSLVSLGMAEYRSGHDAAAEQTLLAAAKASSIDPLPKGISTYYRAMSLSRLGRKDDARRLATETAAWMRPLPADEQNPLASGDNHNDLILWLAHKEAKAMIQFDAAPASAPTLKGK